MPVEVILITRQRNHCQFSRKKGYLGGYREGYRIGRREEQTRWVAWNQKLEEALREGREFTEPPPGEIEKVEKRPFISALFRFR